MSEIFCESNVTLRWVQTTVTKIIVTSLLFKATHGPPNNVKLFTNTKAFKLVKLLRRQSYMQWAKNFDALIHAIHILGYTSKGRRYSGNTDRCLTWQGEGSNLLLNNLFNTIA